MVNPFSVNDSSPYPAPKAVYNWQVYALALSAAMASAMFGYDSAFIGGAITLPSFTALYGLQTASGLELAALKANIVSTFQAGCVSRPLRDAANQFLILCSSLELSSVTR